MSRWGMRFACGLLCGLLLCLFGCQKEVQACETVLREVLTEEADLPVGDCYVPHAEEGQKGFLNDILMRSMYGEDAAERFALVEDYAIYLSAFASPCEIALFRCRSGSDVAVLEEMCRNRADQLRVALKDTAFLEQAQQIRIERRGRTVIMIMTGDSAQTLHVLEGLMR